MSRAQVAAAGLADDAIDWRVRRGRLHVVHRGVYCVGHRVLSARGRWMAAVLSAAPAVLSHRSAAALWDLRVTERRNIEVTAARRIASRPGLQVHQGKLRRDEVTQVDGIPVTSPARTLLDLAAVLSAPQLTRALERAEAMRLTDPIPLDDMLTRHHGARGTRHLQAALAEGIAEAITRSELEDRFLALVEAEGLPRPEINVWLELGARRMEADCVWPAARLMAELDGHATHGTRAAFERDRARDRALQAAGWRVVRITWRQVRREPVAVAADLRRLLRGHQVAFPRWRRRHGG